MTVTSKRFFLCPLCALLLLFPPGLAARDLYLQDFDDSAVANLLEALPRDLPQRDMTKVDLLSLFLSYPGHCRGIAISED